jgi:hypothetical protein
MRHFIVVYQNTTRNVRAVTEVYAKTINDVIPYLYGEKLYPWDDRTLVIPRSWPVLKIREIIWNGKSFDEGECISFS